MDKKLIKLINEEIGDELRPLLIVEIDRCIDTQTSKRFLKSAIYRKAFQEILGTKNEDGVSNEDGLFSILVSKLEEVDNINFETEKKRLSTVCFAYARLLENMNNIYTVLEEIEEIMGVKIAGDSGLPEKLSGGLSDNIKIDIESLKNIDIETVKEAYEHLENSGISMELSEEEQEDLEYFIAKLQKLNGVLIKLLEVPDDNKHNFNNVDDYINKLFEYFKQETTRVQEMIKDE